MISSDHCLSWRVPECMVSILINMIYIDIYIDNMISKTKNAVDDTMNDLTTGFTLTFDALFGLATFRSMSMSKLCELQEKLNYPTFHVNNQIT